MRLLARKIKVIILQLVALLLAKKKQGSALQYQMQPSLVDGMLQAHKGSFAVQTKKNRTTALNYPYDVEYNFTTRFPVGFRGCFICGATYQFERGSCSVKINSKEERNLPFKELWSHKPQTKKKSKEGFLVSDF